MSPARFANVKQSDLPCLKLFIPVHQKIEDYPGSVEDLDFDHLRIWIGVTTVNSDIEATQNQLNNVTKEMDPEERKQLEANLEFMKEAYEKLKHGLEEVERRQKAKAAEESAKTDL